MSLVLKTPLYWKVLLCRDVLFKKVGMFFSEQDPEMMFSVEFVDDVYFKYLIPLFSKVGLLKKWPLGSPVIILLLRLA
jgi:hypothetical protein